MLNIFNLIKSKFIRRTKETKDVLDSELSNAAKKQGGFVKIHSFDKNNEEPNSKPCEFPKWDSSDFDTHIGQSVVSIGGIASAKGIWIDGEITGVVMAAPTKDIENFKKIETPFTKRNESITSVIEPKFIVVCSPDGIVNGDIFASIAIIEGTVRGTITAEYVQLGESAVVDTVNITKRISVAGSALIKKQVNNLEENQDKEECLEAIKQNSYIERIKKMLPNDHSNEFHHSSHPLSPSEGHEPNKKATFDIDQMEDV